MPKQRKRTSKSAGLPVKENLRSQEAGAVQPAKKQAGATKKEDLILPVDVHLRNADLERLPARKKPPRSQSLVEPRPPKQKP
jgi:hypothetical protein